MAGILGVSLGTRLVGIAVRLDGELLDYRVRTFYGVWTEPKRRKILTFLRNMIIRYRPQVLSLKTPRPSHCTDAIKALMEDIKQLSAEYHLRYRVCIISSLARSENGLERMNKRKLMADIVRRHPLHRRLARLYEREINRQTPYYVKLFEAIVCAEIE